MHSTEFLKTYQFLIVKQEDESFNKLMSQSHPKSKVAYASELCMFADSIINHYQGRKLTTFFLLICEIIL